MNEPEIFKEPEIWSAGLTFFQRRVWEWMKACFSSTVQGDIVERQDRFLEEVLELLQSLDYPRDRIRALERYVYGRPKGKPAQEVGGVTVTLAALLTPLKLDMGDCAWDEFVRIWGKIDKIREKQATKPVGSALPAFLQEQGKEDVFEVHVTAPLPEDWFVDAIKHEHTKIRYLGDEHTPLPNNDGAWIVYLQHRKGGRLTWAYGHTMAEAWNNAVAVVNNERKIWDHGR